MAENINFNSSPSEEKFDNEEEFTRENLLDIKNTSRPIANGSTDNNSVENWSIASERSTPNELENTFCQSYNPNKGHLFEETGESSVLAETERSVKNKTKPLDVICKPTGPELNSCKSSDDSDVVQELKSLSIASATIRSPEKKTKDCTKEESRARKREDSEELIFQFDEDFNQEIALEQETDLNLAAGNANAAANSAPINQLERLRTKFEHRIAGLNEMLFTVEILRRYMLRVQGTVEYRGEVVSRTNISRSSSLDSLLDASKSQKSRFDDMNREVKVTWNAVISKCEEFIKNTFNLFREYREQSPEFCRHYVANYIIYLGRFHHQLDLARMVMIENQRDRTLQLFLNQLFGLIANFDAVYQAEYSVLWILGI